MGHSHTLDKYTSSLTMKKCEGEWRGNAQNFCLYLEFGYLTGTFLAKNKAKGSGIFQAL